MKYNAQGEKNESPKDIKTKQEKRLTITIIANAIKKKKQQKHRSARAMSKTPKQKNKGREMDKPSGSRLYSYCNNENERGEFKSIVRSILI